MAALTAKSDLALQCRILAGNVLERHPRLRPNTPADLPWLAHPNNSRLFYALGVTDPVEVVTVRICDAHKPGHAALWPVRGHNCWRWTPDRGLRFMEDLERKLDVDVEDAIYAGLLKELQRRQARS